MSLPPLDPRGVITNQRRCLDCLGRLLKTGRITDVWYLLAFF